MNFKIRKNELTMTVHMRSQDGILGLGNDVPAFSFIQEMVYESLKETYKDLKMGSYHHFADSFHVYERHFLMLFNIVMDSGFTEVEIPRINGRGEVEFLLAGNFELIPEEYNFSKWLSSKEV